MTEKKPYEYIGTDGDMVNKAIQEERNFTKLYHCDPLESNADLKNRLKKPITEPRPGRAHPAQMHVRALGLREARAHDLWAAREETRKFARAAEKLAEI